MMRYERYEILEPPPNNKCSAGKLQSSMTKHKKAKRQIHVSFCAQLMS